MFRKLQRSIPIELIEIKAYEIWIKRQINGESGTPEAEDDWLKAEEFLKKHWWLVFLWKTKKRSQELKVLSTNLIKNAVSSETLSWVANASVLIGAITFIAGEQERRDAQVYQAWQVITAAHGQSGSGGRIQALEFLNSEPRRIPWFWLRWPRETLSGLEASGAYLISSRNNQQKSGIQLSKANLSEAKLERAFLNNANLQKAFLANANLQEVNLNSANLQGASLTYANLQKADLFNADLRGAFLGNANLQEVNFNSAFLHGAKLYNANLQGADLFNARLQGSYYTDKSTTQKTCKLITSTDKYPCPTIFPKGFDPKAAGMELVNELNE